MLKIILIALFLVFLIGLFLSYQLTIRQSRARAALAEKEKAGSPVISTANAVQEAPAVEAVTKEVPSAMRNSIPRSRPGATNAAASVINGSNGQVKAPANLQAEPQAEAKSPMKSAFASEVKTKEEVKLPIEQLELVDLKPYVQAGMMGEQEARQLMNSRHDSYEYFVGLKQCLIPKDQLRLYNTEYFKGINVANFASLSEMKSELDADVLSTIQGDLSQHLELLKKSKSVSELTADKISRLVKADRIFSLSNLYSLANQYHLNEVFFAQYDFSKAVNKGVLEEEPELDLSNDAYDISHYYEQHHMLDFSKLKGQSELDRYKEFLQALIPLLPKNHKYADIELSFADNGRSVYNEVTKDLRCSMKVDGTEMALRFPGFRAVSKQQPVNHQLICRNYQRLVEFFNKVLFELGQKQKLIMVADRVPTESINRRIPLCYATVVLQPVDFESPLVGLINSGEIEEWTVKQIQVEEYIDRMKSSGLLQRYDEQFVDYIRSIAKEYHYVSVQDIFWLFDGLVAPVVPREAIDYPSILESLAARSNGELQFDAIEVSPKDANHDQLSFKVNETAFEASVVSGQIDISFLVDLNSLLAEKQLGQYYLWTWERSSWEQINLVYLHADTIDKCKLPSPDAFIPITQEMTEMYC